MHHKSILRVVTLLFGLMLIFPLASAWVTPGSVTDDGDYEDFGPRIDRILITLYSTQEAEWDAVEAGEIEMTDWPLTDYYITRWSDPPYSNYIKMINYGGEAGYFILDMNNNPEATLPGGDPNPVYPNPMSEYDLRHACAHLVDRPWIISEVTAGLGLAMYTPVPTYMGAFVHPDIKPGEALEDLTHPFSLAEAASILNAGDFPMGTDGWRYWDIDGDNVKDAGEDITLIFYSRADDSKRTMVGDDIFAKLVADPIKIHVDYRNMDKAVCSDDVMGAKDFHLYTGGWIFIGPDPDYLYYLYHPDWYWHPGKPINYGYCGYGLASTHPYLTSAEATAYSDNMTAATEATMTFQEEFAALSAAVPMWCESGAKAMRTTYLGTPGVTDEEDVYEGEPWTGVVNEMGFGINSWWTKLNIHTTGHPVGDGTYMTMRYGYKTSTLDKLNPISAQWYWSWDTMGMCYDSMILRDPQLAWRPYIAYDWKDELWDDAGTLKSMVTYYLHENVLWQDGQQLKSDDVKFSLIEIRDTLSARGLPDPWWISNVAEIVSVDIPDDYTVVVKFNMRSYAAAGMAGGNIILPEHVWRPIVETGDPTTFQPDPNLMGSGPYKFVSYTPYASVVLERNPLFWAYNDAEVHIPHETLAGTDMQSHVGVINRQCTTATVTVNLEYESSPGTWTLVGSKTITIPGNSKRGAMFEAELAAAGLLGQANVHLKASITAPVRGVTITRTHFTHVTKCGDIDSNNYVGLADAITLSTTYGKPAWWFPPADINLDGAVGLKDAVLLSPRYGTSVP